MSTTAGHKKLIAVVGATGQQGGITFRPATDGNLKLTERVDARAGLVSGGRRQTVRRGVMRRMRGQA